MKVLRLELSNYIVDITIYSICSVFKYLVMASLHMSCVLLCIKRINI
jgi:hypothetical protein